MRVPKKVVRGGDVRADDINALIDAVRGLVLRPGPGYRVRSGPDGQALVIERGAGGGGNASGGFCPGFRIYKKTVSGTVRVFVEGGQIGGEMIVEQDLGTLEAMEGKQVIAKVTLNGEDGTYVSVVEAVATLPEITDEIKYVVIGWVGELTGTSTPVGKVVQLFCGFLSVRVCRNWYAAEAPFYGMSLGEPF